MEYDQTEEREGQMGKAEDASPSPEQVWNSSTNLPLADDFLLVAPEADIDLRALEVGFLHTLILPVGSVVAVVTEKGEESRCWSCLEFHLISN